MVWFTEAVISAMLGEGLIGWNMLLCFSELRCSSRLLSTRWYAHFATTYIDPNWTDGDVLKCWLTLLWKIWQNSCTFFCNRNVMWVLESEEILLINQSFVAGPGNLALSFSYKALFSSSPLKVLFLSKLSFYIKNAIMNAFWNCKYSVKNGF